MANSEWKMINSNDDLSETLVILSEDIIFTEILPRLPVKTLIRFKSVSKSWHSLISDSKFVLRHSQFSSCSPHQIILPNCETYNFWLLPYDEMNNLKTPVQINVLDRSCFDYDPHSIDCVGVCNGLICLCNKYFGTELDEDGISEINTDNTFFSICNPASLQYMEIANPNARNQSHLLASSYWFGYVPSVDDYKIVARFSSYRPGPYDGRYVYSVKSGTWRFLTDLSRVLSTEEHFSSNTTVTDDFLFCSAWNMYLDDRRPHHITRFNIVTEEVKQYPWMDWLNVYIVVEFFVLNGKWCLYGISKDEKPFSDVWTLKQHDDWSSWEKLFSIHHGPGMYLRSISPSRKFLMSSFYSLQDFEQFKIIGTSKDTQEQSLGNAYNFGNCTVGCGGGFYFESLIWPFSSKGVSRIRF